MTTILAVLPLVVTLLLMIGFRWSAVRGGAVGHGLAALLGLATPAFEPTVQALGVATQRGALNTVIAMHVLLAGLLFYHVLRVSGVIDRIAVALAEITSDPIRQVLFSVCAFSPFFESASGFGVAIVVIAPILVSLGFEPRQAAILGLLGQNAVPWARWPSGRYEVFAWVACLYDNWESGVPR